MKIKWGRHSFTFLIIPDANSKVVRFRLSAFLLQLIPIVGLTILSITLFIHIDSLKNLNAKNEIKAELFNTTAIFEEALTNKEMTIQELQTNIVALSEQTEEMKLKVEELKALEEEFRSLTSATSTAKDKSTVGISSFEVPDDVENGIGGISEEVSTEDINHLITDTQLTLHTMSSDVGTLKTQLSVSREQLIKKLNLMRITPSIWPTVSTSISSRFGYRKDPFTRRAAYHSGVDISGNSKDPIYAAADGIVSEASYDSAYGNHVIIKHASGVSTLYGHMKKYLVKKGQLVKQGDQIGLLGSTGRSTGPHLHYEVIQKGKSIDPMPYLLSARKGGE